MSFSGMRLPFLLTVLNHEKMTKMNILLQGVLMKIYLQTQSTKLQNWAGPQCSDVYFISHPDTVTENHDAKTPAKLILPQNCTEWPCNDLKIKV